jgi:hypothetical protein
LPLGGGKYAIYDPADYKGNEKHWKLALARLYVQKFLSTSIGSNGFGMYLLPLTSAEYDSMPRDEYMLRSWLFSRLKELMP